jgi:hypothetical protein
MKGRCFYQGFNPWSAFGRTGKGGDGRHRILIKGAFRCFDFFGSSVLTESAAMQLRRKEMKKHLVTLVAILAVIAITVPAFAVEFKYGGMYRLRWQSNDNLTDGTSTLDDNQNYMDQRLRMYFSFVGSENLQVVTKWEVDTIWGNNFDKFSTGGGVGADSINLEMKNVYVDFNIPYTPVRSTLGVQGISLLTGWIIDDDFSAAKFSAKFDPIRVTIGYIAGQNNDVTSTQENIDDIFISLDYAEGPWKASLIGLFQDGHNTDVSTFFNPRMTTGSITQGSAAPLAGFTVGGVPVPSNAIVTGLTNDNFLFDLGLNLGYKIDWVSAYINFVKNFGSFDLLPNSIDRSIDYTGYMIEGASNFYYGPFTFTLGGFLASGDNLVNKDGTLKDTDSDGNFRYPRGASHYWSEIMGLGSLDQAIGGSYLNPVRQSLVTTVDPVTGHLTSAKLVANPSNVKSGDQLNDSSRLFPGNHGYFAADAPSNLWMINAGVAYQALEKTKLTLNYYYIGTQEEVLASQHVRVVDGVATIFNSYDDSIGHEFDFYIDQGIVDGLNLRIVAAYLLANDGYSIHPLTARVNNHSTTLISEDDTWKAGFVLQWNF